MRIKDQDFLTGVMFALVGVGSLATIYFWDRLSMGTPQRPGTGVLPAILSWCLIGTGGLLIIKAMINPGDEVRNWAWRPLLAVTAAIVAFGMLSDDLGLVITMVISLTLCALGTLETQWGPRIEQSLLTAVAVAVGAGLLMFALSFVLPDRGLGIWIPGLNHTMVFSHQVLYAFIVGGALCVLGSRENPKGEFKIFLGAMILIGVGTFIWLLGMPIPAWPTRIPSELDFILR